MRVLAVVKVVMQNLIKISAAVHELTAFAFTAVGLITNDCQNFRPKHSVVISGCRTLLHSTAKNTY